MNEKQFVFEGLNLRYKIRPATKDIRHLVVMFSGIRPDKGYEFDGRASESVQANWLWIRDEVNGEHTYYVSHQSDTKMIDATLALINAELKRLGLEKDQCTLVGFSKGGSAALAIGLKGNFKNILASVPQIAIGTYIQETRPLIMANMLHKNDVDGIEKLDDLIPSLIAKDSSRDKNIYVWSAIGDREYSSQVRPYLTAFEKYENFNSLITDSPLVTTHNEVTKYNLSTIISVLNLIVIGIAPKWGQKTNGTPIGGALEISEIPQGNESTRAELVLSMSKLQISGSKIYPQGIMFLRGQSISGYNQVKKRLTFTSVDEFYEFDLAELKDKWVNSKYFQDRFIDYRYAGFASSKLNGISMNDLKYGDYILNLELEDSQQTFTNHIVMEVESSAVSSVGSDLYILSAGPTGAQITKRPVLGKKAEAVQFCVQKVWTRHRKLHVEGPFAVQGLPVKRWNEVHYILVLESKNETYAYPLSASAKNNVNYRFSDTGSSYRSAYFTTSKFAGLDLSDLPADDYAASITMVNRNLVFTEKIGTVRRIETSNGLEFESI